MDLVWAGLIVVGVTAVMVAVMLLVRRGAPEGSRFQHVDAHPESSACSRPDSLCCGVRRLPGVHEIRRLEERCGSRSPLGRATVRDRPADAFGRRRPSLGRADLLRALRRRAGVARDGLGVKDRTDQSMGTGHVPNLGDDRATDLERTECVRCLAVPEQRPRRRSAGPSARGGRHRATARLDRAVLLRLPRLPLPTLLRRQRGVCGRAGHDGGQRHRCGRRDAARPHRAEPPLPGGYRRSGARGDAAVPVDPRRGARALDIDDLFPAMRAASPREPVERGAIGAEGLDRHGRRDPAGGRRGCDGVEQLPGESIDGEQAKAFSAANAARVESTKASNLANAQSQIDIALFTQWSMPTSPATTTWPTSTSSASATSSTGVPSVDRDRSLDRPSAPDSPFAMPEYSVAGTSKRGSWR